MKRTTHTAAALVAALMLAGCAASAKRVPAPGGPEAQAYIIDCSWSASVTGCYEKAGELCGAAGYRVIATHSDADGYVAMTVECQP